MTLAVLANDDDARGFRLAGVDATLCRSRADVEHAAADLWRHRDGEVGIVIVSESVYRLAPALVDGLRTTARWPILVVLPSGPQEQRRAA